MLFLWIISRRYWSLIHGRQIGTSTTETNLLYFQNRDSLLNFYVLQMSYMNIPTTTTIPVTHDYRGTNGIVMKILLQYCWRLM